MKRIPAVGLGLLAALSLCAGLVLAAGPARSAVLFSDDLRQEVNEERSVDGGVSVETPHGTGWKSTQPYRPLPGQEGFIASDFVTYRLAQNEKPGGKGQIELLLVNDSGLKDGADTVLEFFSTATRETVLAVLVDWNSPGGPTLILDGKGYEQKMFTEDVTLPAVGRGEILHLLLSWDDDMLMRKIVANGVEVAPLMPMENVSTRPEQAEFRRARQKKGGFGSLLAEANTIRLGAMGYHDKFYPGGEQPANETVILGFALHDDPADPAVLGTGAVTAAAEIASVAHNANSAAGFSGALVAGDTLAVSLSGTPGAAAVFDVARRSSIMGEIALDWKGFGVYLEEKTFYEEGEVDLRDVEEYRVYASTEPVAGITADTAALEILEVGEQSYAIGGLEGETPYYVYVMALMDDGTMRAVVEPPAVSMSEVTPGAYEGSYTVDFGQVLPSAVVVGRVLSGESTAAMVGEEEFEVDGSLNLSVAASPTELKADEKSTSNVTVTVTDANGEPVSGHEIRFVLATTSQYTGVVGGGQFAEEVGGSLSRDITAVTDLFGQVEVAYTAGFAAKTAIIVARDMMSNDTGAAYVKTYITAAAELELEAVQEVAGKALGYSITVTSSDEWLTADGESEARVTALVTKDGIPVEGHRVGFSVSAGSGKIRTVQGTTDEDGQARAVYTAGRKIGMVLIRAIDHTVGITGAVQIELRSDAPAKIGVVVTPEVLPADGRSTADVEVVVTDINDNPNEGVEVEYAVAIGSGRLRSIDEVTDSRGESTAQYVAGRIPGKVTIEVTVRSTVPTEEEMAAARDLALAVLDYDFY